MFKSKFSSKLKNPRLILLVIFLLAFAFRYWLIADQHIYFWYDQARDAYLAQQIYLERDLKIQGPSASGTNDTIYHGVFYYYLIGFFYTVFAGDPFLVTIIMALINSAAVFLLYFLINAIFKNKTMALLGAFLLALNFEHAQYSTWLSNPMMGLLPLLVFFLLIWKIFYQYQKSQSLYLFMILGVSLGLIEQSAFYALYFIGVILVAVFYLTNQKKLAFYQLFNLKQMAAFLLSFLATIFTMLLTQYKLFRVGIFSLETFFKAIGQSKELVDLTVLSDFLDFYLQKIIQTLAPQMTLYALFIFLLTLLICLKHQPSQAVKYFFLSWALAPLWLFVIQFRDSPHMLMGMEYLILLLFAFLLHTLFSQKVFFGRLLLICLLSMYVWTQIKALKLMRVQNTNIFTYQTGVTLARELELIEKTYALAQGQPFSISVWTAPYEYYITWAYLYNWHGFKKYGYKPSYFGSSQLGKFGAEILTQKNSIEKLHFFIEEPEVLVLGDIYQQFIKRQNDFSVVVDVNQFGGYKLEVRAASDPAQLTN